MRGALTGTVLKTVGIVSGAGGRCAAAVTAALAAPATLALPGDGLCVLGRVPGLGKVVTQEELSDLCPPVLNKSRFS